jgi:hypothetical protein
VDELEPIELSAVLDFFAAAPPEVADTFHRAGFKEAHVQRCGFGPSRLRP